MKLRSLFLLTIAATFAVVLPSRSHALDVSFSFFQDSLAPYGEWLEVGDYGYCWRPTGMDEDWAPYSDGYWAYTDGGWTWVSYEDFGGIVYHYGRWVRVEDEGWCWKPDYEWAPAWVSWRNNDSHVGWAPLPPEARWERERGFSVWVDSSYDIAPSCYNFVRVVDFGAPVLRPLLCNRRENFGFVQNTVNITNITYNTGSAVIFNGGPDFVVINRRVNRQIPALKLVQNTNITVVNNTIINNNVRVKNVNAVQQGNQLVVVAPNVIRPDAAQVTALVKPNVRRTVPQSRVTKGWGAMPADQRTAIRTKFKQETKDLTPETAPARPMKVADVQAVPVKADPDAPSPTAIRKDRPRPGVPNRDKVTAERDPATVPVAEQPAVVEKPVNPRDAAKIAREKALKQKATPEPQPAEVAISPTPAAPERVKPTRPEVMKPFAPATTNEQPATVKTPNAAEVPPKRTAAQQNAEGRERAAAAREKAAEQQEALRQRQSAQQAQEAAKERTAAQQQQEAVRQRSAEAAQDRQKMLQQQQEQNAARARATEQQEAIRQRQAAQQSQEAARERNAQAAAQRQRAMESQQQPQASQVNEARQRAAEQQQSNVARQQAAERAQVQNAARAQAAQQQQAQAAAREQAIARAQAQNAARQQAPPQRQVVQPQPQPRQAPAQRGGKRQLTPEEAEALKNQR